eukprot:5569902-Ditylum_brightwellii.AAC.1
MCTKWDLLVIITEAMNALPAENRGATAAAARSIMKCVVADRLEEKYTNKNIMLLLQLYNNDRLCKEVLHNTFVDELNAVEEDNEVTKMRPKMHNVCKEGVKHHRAMRGQLPHNTTKDDV